MPVWRIDFEDKMGAPCMLLPHSSAHHHKLQLPLNAGYVGVFERCHDVLGRIRELIGDAIQRF